MVELSNRFMDAILARIDATPNHSFCTIIDERRQDDLNWGELGAMAQRFASLYRTAGIVQGDTALVFLGHGPELYAAFLGALFCGAIPSIMPLLSGRQDPTLFWSSHTQLLRRLSPAYVIAMGATVDEMRAGGLALSPSYIVLADDLPPYSDGPVIRAPESAVAGLQHSSGTTGLKKGVTLSFSSIIAQLDSYVRALHVAEGDQIVSWLPLYHDMGFVACFLLPLYTGMPVRHIDPFYWVTRPTTLLDQLHCRPGTLVWMPNFGFEHLTRIVRDPSRYDLAGVKSLINCSEPCKASTFDRFLGAFGKAGIRPDQLQCCYAMAENTFAATQTPIGQVPTRIRVDSAQVGPGARPITPDGNLELIDVGEDIDGVQTLVVDARHSVVPDGTVGEIALRGTSLFTGYNLDPERTALRLQHGTYYSGDLGLRHAGRLFVLGRSDDLMIINGRNLFAHEIEAALTDVPGVKAGRVVAVSAINDQSGSSDLIVIAERDPAATADDDQIRRYIMVVINSVFAVNPKEVALRDPGWLVKTTSGKISRSTNLVRYLNSETAPA